MTLARIVASRSAGGAPRFRGERFDAEARALACSGNTIIGHLHGAASTAFARAARHIADGPARDCWAWLPAASHHMTIFDLLLHQRRQPDVWPKALPLEASPQEADRYMLDILRGFEPGTDPVFKMCVRALEAQDWGLWVRVDPVSPEENARLRGMRDRLARQTGLHHRPSHASYGFHVTLAYAIDWPSAKLAAATDILIGQADEILKSALPVFDIGPPEVCLFDDMCAFRPQFTLQ